MANSVSFYDVISKKINIPLIQRDYVQGLNLTKNINVRNRLLKDIIHSLLQENDAPHDLGMIYGSFDNAVFKPFDGQQRITTMWIFCLFLISKMKYYCNNYDKHFEDIIRNNFSYQVRNTTIDFIELLKTEFLDNYLKVFSAEGVLSHYLKNMYRYYDKYDSDPTIQSMLGMIESIDLAFKENGVNNENIKLIYNNISNNNHIYFNYVDLGKYLLTDDIYIKLNARGLPLTDFENLKARIIGIIETYEAKNDVKIKLADEFSKICDIQWENDFVFENDQDLKKEELSAKIDERRINFIRIFLINEYFSIMTVKMPEKYYREIIPQEYSISNESFAFEIDNIIKYTKEEGVFTIKTDNIEFIYNAIKKLVAICKTNIIHEDLIGFYEKYSVLAPNSSPAYKVLFEYYSIFEYIYVNKDNIASNTANYYDFKCFINNILDNYSNAGAEELVKFFNNIKSLIANCNNDIIGYLAKVDINSAADFSLNYIIKSNVISEICKAKLSSELRNKMIDKFGVHLSYIFEYVGILSAINKDTFVLNGIPKDILEKANIFEDYIDVDETKTKIKFKEDKIDLIRMGLLKAGCSLKYKPGGFSFGTNLYRYDDETYTFDYILHSFKDDSIIQIRNIIFDIINKKEVTTDIPIYNVLISNFNYVKDILDKGFVLSRSKVLIFTDKHNFSGYCYDVLLYIKSQINKIDYKPTGFLGCNKWADGCELQLGKDIYKVGSKFGYYYINGIENKLLDNNYCVV